MSDLIIKGAGEIKDGLYNIKDGKLFQYKENGGTVRTYPIVSADRPKWIPCSEGMPEEREWIGTKRFGTTKSDEVYVTFETPNGDRFAKHLSFQNGKLSVADQQTIDVICKGSVPVAWMPLPEPYEESDEQ